MNQSSKAFSRIISPVDEQEFFEEYWEKKPLFISRDEPAYYSDALTTADIDSYLQNQHVSPSFLNVMLRGEPCPPEQWTFSAVRASDNFSQSIVDLEKLFKLFNEGATIIINAGETAFSSLIDLRQALENELKSFVQANIYITPPNSQGFAPHFDAHNVFILQIHGTKRWNLYDSPFDSPVRTTSVKEMRYEEREPEAEFEMKPGDLLYIPRGIVHSARADKISSIHVTVGPMLRHWTRLLKLLAKKADDNASFRRLLPHGLSTESERAKFETEFRWALQELLENIDLSALVYADFIDDRRTNNRGRFTDLLGIEQLTPASVVCRRSFLDYLVERDAQWLKIHFAEEEIILPVFLESSLDKILGEKSFAIREIEGIPNEAGKTALVRRFVQAGFLTVISL